MSDDGITRMSMEDILKARGTGKTNWERLRREDEAGIEPERDEDEGEIDWSTARVVYPEPCKAVSIRLDPDVLEFFKQGGKGYQTRINAVLRSYVAARRAGK